jgi:hypothetical protein
VHVAPLATQLYSTYEIEVDSRSDALSNTTPPVAPLKVTSRNLAATSLPSDGSTAADMAIANVMTQSYA